MRRYLAEGIGAFAVVLCGCGVIAVGGDRLGDAGVALAFGLALAVMTVAAAPISGAHLNPAITLAMALAGRLRRADVLPYWAAQLAGGTVAAGLVVAVADGRPGRAPLAAEAMVNGYGQLSPGFYGVTSALLTEVTLTALFALAVLGVAPPARGATAIAGEPRPGATPARAEAPSTLGPRPAPHPGVRPASIALLAAVSGAAYALVHLVGRPVTGLSANPARSLGPALLAGGPALAQVWLFMIAPLAGGLLGALGHRALWGAGRSEAAPAEAGPRRSAPVEAEPRRSAPAPNVDP